MASAKVNPYKKWFKVGCIAWPAVSLINDILPFVAVNYINKKLQTLPGFKGHLHKIETGIFTPTVKVKGIYVDRLNENTLEQAVFVSAKFIEIKLDYKELWNGNIDATLIADSPSIALTKDLPTGSASTDIQVVIKRCEIVNGKLEFLDDTKSEPVKVEIDNISIVGTNLSNIEEAGIDLPFEALIKASLYSGTIRANLKANLLKDEPTFDMNAELADINLAGFNDVFRAYAGFDINKGEVGLFTEVAARGGAFNGYVKAVIEDLEVMGPKDKKDSWWQLLKEALIGAVAEAVENHKEDQIATKIPFSGTFANPKINVGFAIGEILKNAFVHALRPTLDHSINLSSVDTNPKS